MVETMTKFMNQDKMRTKNSAVNKRLCVFRISALPFEGDNQKLSKNPTREPNETSLLRMDSTTNATQPR